MSQEAVTYIKLQISAGEANPAPPVGPALSQHGVNIMDFCKQFNERSKESERGLKLPVVISVNKDKSFSFEIKTPPAAVLLKKLMGLEKGSGRPNSEKVGNISMSQLEEIARQKQPDLTAADLDAAVRTIAGTAKSMGLNVEV